jgi:hypothetical protein
VILCTSWGVYSSFAGGVEFGLFGQNGVKRYGPVALEVQSIDQNYLSVGIKIISFDQLVDLVVGLFLNPFVDLCGSVYILGKLYVLKRGLVDISCHSLEFFLDGVLVFDVDLVGCDKRAVFTLNGWKNALDDCFRFLFGVGKMKTCSDFSTSVSLASRLSQSQDGFCREGTDQDIFLVVDQELLKAAINMKTKSLKRLTL